MRFQLLLLLSLWGLTVHGQLRNPSFELTDTLNQIRGWESLAGNTTRLTAEQFGILPFVAAKGNAFIKLETDSQANPIKRGIVRQVSAFTDTPGSLYFQYLYVPVSADEFGAVSLLLTKWNGSSRDTVLFVTDSIQPVVNGSQLPIQWNLFSLNLNDQYRLTTLPDSLTLTFTNDVALGSNRIRLYLDDITFGAFSVGIPMVRIPTWQLYPNPASNELTISGITPKIARLFHLDGQVTELQPSFSAGECHFDVSNIPNGLYVIYLDEYAPKRLLIQR